MKRCADAENLENEVLVNVLARSWIPEMVAAACNRVLSSYQSSCGKMETPENAVGSQGGSEDGRGADPGLGAGGGPDPRS